MSNPITSRPQIVVTGANGQVGNALLRFSKQNSDWDFHFYERKSLDITDKDQLRNILHFHFDYLINTAAYTAVDKAESEPDIAFQINQDGPAILAAFCQEKEAGLLHLSSDYVYHNILNRPLRESDPASPQGVYAKSKLAGDEAVLNFLPDAIVMRTSWVYSEDGHNFVKTMLKLCTTQQVIRVVNDQTGKPTWADSIAQAAGVVLKNHFGGNPLKGGIYHYADAGHCTWYEFACKIFELQNNPIHVVPIHASDYPTPAVRPINSILDTTKWELATGFVPGNWEENLGRCLTRINELNTQV